MTCHQEEELQSHKEVICKSTVGHHSDAKIPLRDRNSMYVRALKSLKWHWGQVKI